MCICIMNIYTYKFINICIVCVCVYVYIYIYIKFTYICKIGPVLFVQSRNCLTLVQWLLLGTLTVHSREYSYLEGRPTSL